MLILSILFLLSSYAVTSKRDKSILYVSLVITILISCFFVSFGHYYLELYSINFAMIPFYAITLETIYFMLISIFYLFTKHTLARKPKIQLLCFILVSCFGLLFSFFLDNFTLNYLFSLANVFFFTIMIANSIYKEKKTSYLNILQRLSFFCNYKIIWNSIQQNKSHLLLSLFIIWIIILVITHVYNYFTNFSFENCYLLHVSRLLFISSIISIIFPFFLSRIPSQQSSKDKGQLSKALDNITFTRFIFILSSYTIFIYSGLGLVIFFFLFGALGEASFNLLTISFTLIRSHSLINNFCKILSNYPLRIGNFAVRYSNYYGHNINKSLVSATQIDYLCKIKYSNFIFNQLFGKFAPRLVSSFNNISFKQPNNMKFYISDVISKMRIIDVITNGKPSLTNYLWIDSKFNQPILISNNNQCFIKLPLKYERFVFISTNKNIIELINNLLANKKLTNNINLTSNSNRNLNNNSLTNGLTIWDKSYNSEFNINSIYFNNCKPNNSELNVNNIFSKPVKSPWDSVISNRLDGKKDLSPEDYEYNVNLMHNMNRWADSFSNPRVMMMRIETMEHPFSWQFIDIRSINNCLSWFSLNPREIEVLNDNMLAVYNAVIALQQFVTRNNLIITFNAVTGKLTLHCNEEMNNLIQLNINILKVSLRDLIKNNMLITWNGTMTGVETWIAREIVQKFPVISQQELHQLTTEVYTMESVNMGTWLEVENTQQIIDEDALNLAGPSTIITEPGQPNIMDAIVDIDQTSEQDPNVEMIYSLTIEREIRTSESLIIERLSRALFLLRLSFVKGMYYRLHDILGEIQDADTVMEYIDLIIRGNDQYINAVSLGNTASMRTQRNSPDLIRILNNELNKMNSFQNNLNNISENQLSRYFDNPNFVEMRLLQRALIDLVHNPESGVYKNRADLKTMNIIKNLYEANINSRWTRRGPRPTRVFKVVVQNRIKELKQQLGLGE